MFSKILEDVAHKAAPQPLSMLGRFKGVDWRAVDLYVRRKAIRSQVSRCMILSAQYHREVCHSRGVGLTTKTQEGGLPGVAREFKRQPNSRYQWSVVSNGGAFTSSSPFDIKQIQSRALASKPGAQKSKLGQKFW